MSNLRQRKPVTSDARNQTLQHHEEESPKEQKAPDLSPDLRVVISFLLGLMTIITTYYYYRVDLRNRGPFAAFVNDKIIGFNPYERGGLPSNHGAHL